jgi:nitrite reductase/ring-hydroxylating ferredoxin subunit
MAKTYTLGNSKAQIQKMIPKSVIKKVMVGDRSIGLIQLNDSFYAFSSTCPHRGASLIEGSINGIGEIICPLHHYRFDIKTGQVKSGSCGDLEVFPCELLEGGLKITLPEN